MPAPYSPITIAHYFTTKEPCDHLKLQKLLYFAHGFYLANYNKPLLNDFFQAWPYGPVISSLYHDFKKFNKQPITSSQIHPKEEITPGDKQFLDQVWDLYGHADGALLSRITHEKNSPWEIVAMDIVKKGINTFRPINIPDVLLYQYFSEWLNSELNKKRGLQ